MKITTISVKYGGKINLGNYQSATVEAKLWASIDEDDDPVEALQALFDTCKASVRANVPKKEVAPSMTTS